MRNSSRLQSFLLATCLLPLCIGACSKETKNSEEKKSGTTETVPEESLKVTETAPGGDKKEMPAVASTGALAYLPDSCAIAIHLDIASALKNGDVGKSFLPKVKGAFEAAKTEKPEMSLFFAAADLDPFADFHEMGICLSNIPVGGGDPKGMGVITGDTKVGVIIEYLRNSKKADKFTPVDFAGVKGLERDGILIAQLDDGTLIAGNDRALMEAAVKKPSGQGAAFASVPKATLRVVVPTATVKMVFNLPKSPMAKFSDKIDGVSSLSADLDSRSVTLRIGTASNEAATELSGVAKVMLGQVPAMNGKSLEARGTTALAAAKVAGEGTSMVGTVTFDEATAQQGLDEMAANVN